MCTPIILGLSASLRNARSSTGSVRLTDEVSQLKTRDDLDLYLQAMANEHLEQFIAAGRKDGLPFDDIYRNLQKSGNLRGLSNSEIVLAAGLWGAQSKGAQIDHVPLPDHFPANGGSRNLDILKAALMRADGILLSTPVYFGDRGSLAQQFIEMIRSDSELREAISAKLFAGLAVGAKRNGGQETTLIYALMDMLNIGFLGVGNDSETTSQYGGTTHAGDIGTAPKDKYGIDTSIGVGRRIGSVAVKMMVGKRVSLKAPMKVNYWLLQDKDSVASNWISQLIQYNSQGIDSRKTDLLGDVIRPCIACDICPIHVGPDDEYRCIIKRKDDALPKVHSELLNSDVIVPALYSPVDRTGLQSVYQQFMERTRYLRRGDYVFTDRLVIPLIFAELGSGENLDIRVMTSMIRHHTVLAKPIVAWLQNGVLLNKENVFKDFNHALSQGRLLTQGNLASVQRDLIGTQYQPVGYVLASAVDKEQKTMNARENAVNDRLNRQQEDALARLKN